MKTNPEALSFTEIVEELGKILRGRKKSCDEREREAIELLITQDKLTEKFTKRKIAEELTPQLKFIETLTQGLLKELSRYLEKNGGSYE